MLNKYLILIGVVLSSTAYAQNSIHCVINHNVFGENIGEFLLYTNSTAAVFEGTQYLYFEEEERNPSHYLYFRLTHPDFPNQFGLYLRLTDNLNGGAETVHFVPVEERSDIKISQGFEVPNLTVNCSGEWTSGK